MEKKKSIIQLSREYIPGAASCVTLAVLFFSQRGLKAAENQMFKLAGGKEYTTTFTLTEYPSESFSSGGFTPLRLFSSE